MKGLTLTQREQTRLQVLNHLVGHQIVTPEAAKVLVCFQLLALTIRALAPNQHRSQPQKRRIIPVAGLRWVGGKAQKDHLAVEKGVAVW